MSLASDNIDTIIEDNVQKTGLTGKNVKIYYDCVNMPGGVTPAGNNLCLTTNPAAIIWAAVTVGRANVEDILKNDYHSEFEIIYRMGLIIANLAFPEEESTNICRLVRSSAYESLDPSEKGAVSYFIGLTFAKLFANELFNTPWLMHLDSYKQDLSVQFTDGNSRPDLIGLDTNKNWIVIEAKGRSDGRSNKAMERAKKQVKNLHTIQNQEPKLRVAFQSYFKSKDNEDILHLELNDPPSRSDNINLDITPDHFQRKYYRLIENWLANNDHVRYLKLENETYAIRQDPVWNISIGKKIPPIEGQQVETSADTESHSTFVGKDDVIIQIPSRTSKIHG